MRVPTGNVISMWLKRIAAPFLGVRVPILAEDRVRHMGSPRRAAQGHGIGAKRMPDALVSAPDGTLSSTTTTPALDIPLRHLGGTSDISED